MPKSQKVVCGVDVGSLKTPSYVAWLRDGEFILDMYMPESKKPLPTPPRGWLTPVWTGFDAPQGLPSTGSSRRKADRLANTPTRKLPKDREALAEWKLYRGLVEAGIQIFWWTYEEGTVDILGLTGTDEGRGCGIFETYPRYVISRLWQISPIPSKRSAALSYVDSLWGEIQAAGYRCNCVIRPSVDQVDAMLCALAAESLLSGNELPSGTVGEMPRVDIENNLLREGLIVSP